MRDSTISEATDGRQKAQKVFVLLTGFTLLYNLFVVAFGAFVRVSFSGDGCGQHWPDCGGTIIPTINTTQRLVEFSHRISSGLVLVLTGAMIFFASRAFAKGHQAIKLSIAAFCFTVSEALLGAGLVWFKLVAHDDSVYRAVAMSSHLTNTFILLGCITLALATTKIERPIRLKDQGAVPFLVGLGVLSIIFLGITGAISALGHTVRPVADVLAASMKPDAHFLNRLQPFHPLIATSVGLYLLLMGGMLIHLRPGQKMKAAVQWTVVLYFFQLALGLINIALQAPAWLQLVHLVAADSVWIAMIFSASIALSQEATEAAAFPVTIPAVRPKGKALVKEYVALTKPRVISLLLFTTLAALYAAAWTDKHTWPSFLLVAAVTIGGYMAAGAANAINMVIDRDIDGNMKRTSKRPTVTQNIPSSHALFFAFAMSLGSFAILWAAANLLCAMLAFAGLVFYVIVYTMLLKRRTWHNIVIGGAAGAFPPLVGWAAVTNNLSPLAYYMFAIVFMWTPVHFWALALLIKDDYREAGIPMLPVVHGERVTAIQICFYGILTTIVSVMPIVQKTVGAYYLYTAVVLNVVLLLRCVALYRTNDRPHAVSLYKYSMLYLFLLFLMVAVDKALIWSPTTSAVVR